MDGWTPSDWTGPGACSTCQPYAKYQGAHWRLVEFAELGVPLGPEAVRPAVELVLAWAATSPATHVVAAVRPPARPRLHASIPGNVVYACTTLGFGSDPRVRHLVDVLLGAQWPDGGWNCDRHADAHRSSFHETVTPAIGLASYGRLHGDGEALAAAHRAGELLLEHRLFRRHGTGGAIHPTWIELHYPPYWHYDVLQGLRLVAALGRIADERAADALEVVASRRGPDGGFAAASWNSSRYLAAVDYGRGSANVLLRERAEAVLAAGGRLP